MARSQISKNLNPGSVNGVCAPTASCYHNVGSSVTLFYGDRGAGQYNATSLFDLSLQYSLPISRVTPWVKFDVQNVTNDKTLLTYNTSITPDTASPLDSFGYPTGYKKAASFGRPVGATSYVIPRTYLVYAGIRF